jgi:RNA polymerase sigma factor (sigma-70 family)
LVPASDGQLLDRFVRLRDEAAFTELVHRHGRLVQGVARRHLADRHAADDVFQATFLALARQAARLSRGGPLEGWLYTVAYRLARKEQARAARRRLSSPAEEPASSAADPQAQLSSRELVQVIDDELARLPERYRLPLLLCGLDGLSRDEVAARLGWTVGTLRGRLERGRELLRQRLTARGLIVPTVLVAGCVTDPLYAVPAPLISATARAALAVPLAGAVPLKAIAIGMILLTALGVGLGAAALSERTSETAADPPSQAAPGNLVPRVDALGDPLPERAMRRLGTARFRHGNQIMALARSADGHTIATGGLGEIRFWDAASGRLRKILRTEGGVFALGFSAAGGRLVSAGTAETRPTRGKLVIWDTAAGKPLRTVTHKGTRPISWVRSAAITADGKTVAMSCDDGSLQILDVSTGEVRHNLGAERRFVRAVALSPDGQRLAAAGDRNAVCVWDVATGAERVRLPDAPDLHALTFSPDGQLLATAHAKGLFEAGTIRLWDLATRREQWSVRVGSGKAFSGGVLALAFSPDGQRLASGDIDGTTEVRDARTGEKRQQHKEGDGSVHGVVFSPDGQTLYAAGTDGRVWVWAAATGAERFQQDQHTGAVVALSPSPDGRTLATSGADRTIRLWDLTTGRTRTVLRGHRQGVYSVQFLRDGRRLVSAGGDGTVRVWDTATGQELQKLLDPANGWNARLAVSPNGNLLAIGEVQRVRLWDLAAAREVRQLRGHTGYIMNLSFSADGAFLATAAHSYAGDTPPPEDWTIRVWNITTGEEVFQSKQLSPGTPIFTADGRGVMFLGQAEVHVFDFLSGQARPDPGWTDVQTLAPSPGAMWLATAHADGTIRIRAAGTGQEVLRYQADAGPVWNVFWSADGKRLYSAHGDTTVLEWDLAPRGGSGLSTAEQAWAGLSSGDGPAAYRAAWWFLTAADPAAELKPRLQMVPDGGTDQRVRGLVTKLDDDRFAVREEAERELTALGPVAEPSLIQAAAATTSAEIRQRVRAILRRLPAQPLTADEYRGLRAVEVLEHVANSDARRILATVAKGDPDARLTRAAAAALQRLGSR